VTTLRAGISCRKFICRLSVLFVHLTHGFKLLAIFLHHCVSWPSFDLSAKFHVDVAGKPLGALNATWVAKYRRPSHKWCKIWYRVQL